MRSAVPRIALLAVLVLFAAACGDDDGGTPFTTTTSGSGGTATSGASSTTGGSGTTSGSDTTSGSEEGLAELLERSRQVPLRLTYLTGEGADREEITFSQDPTLDPPASAMIFADGKAIFLEDSMVFCGGEGGAATCFEMPAEGGTDFIGAMMSPFALLALAGDDLVSNPGFQVETDGISMAGRRGICFTFRPTLGLGGETEYVRQCVDDELGFTLLLEAKEVAADAVERVMELTAMGDPEPGDFEPTGPVTPLPTG